jgi:decaprenyl-phosphate phosphoribosyltransferase
MEAVTSRAIGWPLARLLRPKQWIKNLLVVAPLIFSASFVKFDAMSHTIIAFWLMTVAASAVYILNDLLDIDADRVHPTKRLTRPLASGAVRPGSAILLLIVLYGIILSSFFYLPEAALTLCLYVLINVAYSVRLKHIPVLDLFVLGSGFVIRVYVGAAAIHVELSFWMFITTLCLALYLAAGKRRQELLDAGTGARSVLALYTVPLLDYYALLSAVSAILFYGLFVATARPELSITLPCVLFGLFRYRYLMDMQNQGESPTDAIWGDIPLILCVLVWAVLSVYATTHK